jgi:hypothetical protein
MMFSMVVLFGFIFRKNMVRRRHALSLSAYRRRETPP